MLDFISHYQHLDYGTFIAYIYSLIPEKNFGQHVKLKICPIQHKTEDNKSESKIINTWVNCVWYLSDYLCDIVFLKGKHIFQ